MKNDPVYLVHQADQVGRAYPRADVVPNPMQQPPAVPPSTLNPQPSTVWSPPDWDSPYWRPAQTLEIAHFRPESSDHRPRTSARLLYDAKAVTGIFRVQDQYVRSLRTDYQSEVWKDSCVEFFVQPKPRAGYFNFEFNCGGAFLCYHIDDPERTPDGFKKFEKIPAELGQTIRVKSSLPRKIEKEISEPVVWTLSFRIPFSLVENVLGPLGSPQGQTWRANFFKCAEEVSHPHWASWAPVDEFNFHRPHCFGTIRLV